jgi:O-antigen ligase/tetratricopeptide (TPR) repeat protein
MGKARKKIPARNSFGGLAIDDLIFWFALGVLVVVPLAFSSLVYTRYSLPKFVVLLVGSSMLSLLLVLNRVRVRDAAGVQPRSRLVWIVYVYFAAVGVSTIFGVSPVASLFGSHFNYMGFITRLCFLIVFLALIAGIATSEKRLRAILWGISATGFLVAAYGVMQSFGIEPFVSRNLYTFASPGGPLVRVSSTLGHSNYLGNFLLYATPISAGLALAERGWPRMFAIASAALSAVAIIFSGTRGAWIGIVAGAAIFVALELNRGAATAVVRSYPVVLAAGVLAALLLGVIIVISPASRSVRERMKALVSEGTSSSGRALLWRDSLRMVPAFPLGCGPEGFRKAFLAFKSKELAQLSPKANNESPHSAYLEIAISNGLLGAALYVAMIVMALGLLIRARRRAVDRSLRIIMTGIVSSFVAALVHNIFIFDQITTGLYFFAFIGLAQATSNVTLGPIAVGNEKRAPQPTPPTRSIVRWKWTGPSRALATGAALLVVGSLWYTTGLVRSEMAYRELFDPTKPVDFEKLVELGGRVTSSPLPTGSYNFAFARVVDTFVKKLPAASIAAEGQSKTVDMNAIRASATKLAIDNTEVSLSHTLTPDLNYSLLASLAIAAGDADRLSKAASEAVRWDPNNYQTRCLMAEAYLVRGERDNAAREAEIALDLYHVSPEAASVLARANGENPADQFALGERMARLRVGDRNVKRSVEELIEAARQLAQANKLTKARVKLLTASLRAGGTCPDCHRELAIVCERMGRNSEAITQWEIFIEQAPERASTEQVEARIAALRQKDRPRQ